MKLLLVGLWITLVALGSAFAATNFLFLRPETAGSAAPVTLQPQKTRVLNVPMIADGVVQGFVSAQFVFTIDGTTLKSLPVPPELYLLDEAFRTLYTDGSLDFRHLEKYDLAKLTKHLVDATNAHLGAPLIRDVLIADLTYSPKGGNAD